MSIALTANHDKLMTCSEDRKIQNRKSKIENLLETVDLCVYFDTDAGDVPAVDGVSLSIAPGEPLGLVGESGCGKSVTAYAILQLIPAPPARYANGEIRFRNENPLALDERGLRRVSGNQIAMIFQEPMSSLNPIMSIGRQITE